MRDRHLIHRSFSAERLQTYEAAAARMAGHTHAFELYEWNMHISCAFMLPLHTCEIVIRNAVADAIALRHGPAWPWQDGLRLSLPGSAGGYNARDELRRAAGSCSSTPSVVAGLRFAFWQHMFTQRFDQSLWSKTIQRVMPGSSDPARQTRARTFADLERVRHLRNRIAHHEPIFGRDLDEDLTTILRLVRLRCPHVGQWMQIRQTVSALLIQGPSRFTPPAASPCPNAG
ncbi:hypothetical protein [Stenotrophomonas sp. AB1(2024)]|uniref:hypothetical protein n=1 Tax=Stenotrophomonas sp. AB1(2024) TaxID=3132215 RepID=UPI0030996D68